MNDSRSTRPWINYIEKNYSAAAVFDKHIQNADQSVIPESKNMLDHASTACTIVMIWMCLCGIIGNSLSLYVYRGPSFRNHSINILLAALSVTDLFLCILAIPVFSFPQIQQYCAGLSKFMAGHTLLFAYPVTLMFQSMSIWLLVSITIDRYLAVCHPFTARIYCTKFRARVTVIIIIVFSIAYNVVRFWEFRIDETDDALSFEDSIVPELRANPLFMLLYQNIATLVTQFFIPLIVLCYLNLHVAQTIRDVKEQRKHLVASEKREYSIAKMMIFVVIVFTFCYTLSMVLNLIEILHEELFRQEIGYLLNDVNNILVVLNSSSSFIFYAKYSTRFRAQLRSIWFIRCFAARLPCCFIIAHERGHHERKCVGTRSSFLDNVSFYSEGKYSRVDVSVQTNRSLRTISADAAPVPAASYSDNSIHILTNQIPFATTDKIASTSAKIDNDDTAQVRLLTG